MHGDAIHAFVHFRACPSRAITLSFGRRLTISHLTTRLMLKRILIPPLIPVVVLAILAMWAIFDDTQSTPNMIDGRPDNAPIRAAGILLFMAPFLYIPFGLLNLVDSVFDRFSSRVGWSASVGICILLSTLLTSVFYQPDVDTSAFPGVGFAVLASFMFLMPMSLIRRSILTPHKEKATMISGATVPFETLFPNAKSAPKMKRTEQDVHGDAG